jgi:hypothetical protein
MKSIENIEVKLYLRRPWAEALTGFVAKGREVEALPVELKGALIEICEALSDFRLQTSFDRRRIHGMPTHQWV